MKQQHTETGIQHTSGQQDTGNHNRPDTEDVGGADRFGGTRAGAENVERISSDKVESVETGTDVSKVSSLDQTNASEKSPGNARRRERAPERDERGRL